MKVNDIIEREFDGNVFRFQITELRPREASIVVLDDTLPLFERDISSRLSPIFTNYMFAIIENDGFVTTKEGNIRLRYSLLKCTKEYRIGVLRFFGSTQILH